MMFGFPIWAVVHVVLMLAVQECLGKYNHSLLAAFQRMPLDTIGPWSVQNTGVGPGVGPVAGSFWESLDPTDGGT